MRPPSSRGRVLPPSQSGAASTSSGSSATGTGRNINSRSNTPVTKSPFLEFDKDRPITQQGLTSSANFGSVPQSRSGKRTNDISHYTLLLKTKVEEIQAELERLEKESEVLQKENRQFSQKEKEFQEVSAEIKDLEEQVSDYNFALDKIREEVDVKDLERHGCELEDTNGEEREKLDRVFLSNKRKQDEIGLVEKEIENIMGELDRIISSLPSRQQEEYEEINSKILEKEKKVAENAVIVENLKAKVESEQLSLGNDKFAQLYANLETQLSSREEEVEFLKQELELTTLNEMEAKDFIVGKAQQKNEDLKRDNKKIEEAEYQIKFLSKQKAKVLVEIKELEDSKHAQSRSTDPGESLEMLQQKEVEMDNFLSQFPQSFNFATSERERIERSIVALLEQISVELVTEQGLDVNKSRAIETKTMSKDELLEHLQHLETEYKTVSLAIAAVDDQVFEINSKVAKFKDDFKLFSDVENIKLRARELRDEMVEKIKLYKFQHENLSRENKDLIFKLDQDQQSLNDNKTHEKLKSLEDKLLTYQNSNSQLVEQINKRREDQNYQVQKQECFKMFEKLNTMNMK